MSLLALLSLLTPLAHAFCFDLDGDGAGPGCTPISSDCAPSNAAVNPGEPEDGIDNVDNDCDGSELVHRLYVSPLDAFFATDWTITGGVTAVSGTARFNPAGSPARINLKSALAFTSGELTVTTRFTSMAGPTCWVSVASTSLPGLSVVVGSGTTVTTFPGVLPGDSVTTLEVGCTGAVGQANLDWVTVQNGPYTWAPTTDVSASFETMGMPGVGRQSVVRTSEDGVYAFVGSDVGGMGWTADGYDWYAANGDFNDFSDGSDDGVWDIWSPGADSSSTLDAYVLTGDKDSGDSGGLYYTTNLGASTQGWTAAPGGLGATKHIDDCPDDYFKPISSGRLLVQAPDDTSVLLVASSDPDTRGIWRWDTASPTTAPVQPFDPDTLPTTTNPDTAGYDALPSALAVVGDYVVIGYKVVAETSLGEYTALYRCPSAGLSSAVESIACEPVLDDITGLTATDVRDIEVSTAQGEEDVFYVADGGRTWEEASSGCVLGESTVYRVAFGSTGSMEVYDTDRVTTANPSWNRTSASSTAQPYFDSGACLDNNALGATTYGELVPARGLQTSGTSSEGFELSTIAMDPGGTFLYAFYPLNDGAREYGCARVFRTEVGDIAEEATPWLPVSGYEYGQMAFNETSGTLHADIRRGVVDMNGAFLDAEPLAEDFAGAAVHDAVFEWAGDIAGQEFDLLAGGNFLWRLLGELRATSGAGWDTATPANTWATDLDYAEWELAWGGDAAFQDASANALALCPGCLDLAAYYGDLGLAAGIGDYKMARLYADAGGSRAPADRSCEVHKLNSTGSDVSVWVDPTGASAPQAWMALNGQDTQTDTALARGLLYSDDAVVEDWCWDAMADGNFSPGAYTEDAASDGNWELVCQDGGFVSASWWDSCDQSGGGDPWNMEDGDIGVVRSIVAIGDEQAVAVAAPGALDSSGTLGGEGLWLLTRDATSGIAYEEVYFPPGGVDTTGDGIGDCSASELFAYTARGDVAVHPDTKPSAGKVRVFVTGKHADCGLFEVKFDPATVTTAATWTEVDLSGGGCTLTSSWIQGSAVARDGEWLLAYGGGYEATPSTVDDPDDTQAVSGGGICAFDLTSGTTPSAWTRENAASATSTGLEIRTLLPHPHLDDTFYFGGWGTFDCVAGCKDPGVYALQRRYSANLASWVWSSTRLSGDDLEHRTVSDLDWGVGHNLSDSPMSRLYVTTAGGGYWDGAMTVE